jgi:hypothetical protein
MTAKIDRLLIGDNPFNGVSHRSRERGRSRAAMLSEKEIIKIIETALDNGAQGLVFSVTPKMLSVLKYMKENGWNRELHLYPIIPDVLSLVNESAELGMAGLLSRFLEGLSVQGKLKFMVKGGLAALSLSPVELIKVYLDTEIARIYATMPQGAGPRAIFLHEVVTDTVVGLRIPNVLQEYSKYVQSKFGVVPGLVTRNFPKLTELAQLSAVPLCSAVVMTPFNAVGFQMNPSRQYCEDTLSKQNRPIGEVIAMSILAAGSLTLKQAIHYLNGLSRLSSCVVGVSNESQAKETFSFLKDNFVFRDY